MDLSGVDSSGHEVCHVFFFFQAEDGIRDLTVTGVQTCALPISQPATVLLMMLLVTLTADQLAGIGGKVSTSVPLAPLKARPPPLPLSAALPWIRLALMTSPGPAPSPGPTGGMVKQSASGAGHSGSASGAPMTRMPPPLVAMVGFALWLNR